MLLRAKKVDILTIALWLGHESTTTTEVYLHADNTIKQEAIDADRDRPRAIPTQRRRDRVPRSAVIIRDSSSFGGDFGASGAVWSLI